MIAAMENLASPSLEVFQSDSERSDLLRSSSNRIARRREDNKTADRICRFLYMSGARAVKVLLLISRITGVSCVLYKTAESDCSNGVVQ